MSVKIIKASEMEKVGNEETGAVLLHFNGQVHETVAYYSYDDLSCGNWWICWTVPGCFYVSDCRLI